MLTGECKADHRTLHLLFPDVYEQLKRAAARCLASRLPGYTLSATEVVGEVYLRIYASDPQGLTRARLIVLAGMAMRHVLVDHDRRRRAAKRGGGRVKWVLDDATVPAPPLGRDWLDMDGALEKLRTECPDLEQVVMLKYFGGMSNQEVAEETGWAVSTVDFKRSKAFAWLRKELNGVSDHERPRHVG